MNYLLANTFVLVNNSGVTKTRIPESMDCSEYTNRRPHRYEFIELRRRYATKSSRRSSRVNPTPVGREVRFATQFETVGLHSD